jgi:hypothetical protein
MKYIRRKAEGILKEITLDFFSKIEESPVLLPPIFREGSLLLYLLSDLSIIQF